MNKEYNYELTFINKYDEELMMKYINEQNIPNTDTLIPIVKDKLNTILYILHNIPGIHSIVSFVKNGVYRIKITVINTEWKKPDKLTTNTEMYLHLNENMIAFFTQSAMEAFFLKNN